MSRAGTSSAGISSKPLQTAPDNGEDRIFILHEKAFFSVRNTPPPPDSQPVA
ncbi:MAG: hypothetical protein V4634_13810 [Pseudomonadota bacterium]